MSLHNEVQEYIRITKSIQVESLERLADLIYNVSKNGKKFLFAVMVAVVRQQTCLLLV